MASCTASSTSSVSNEERRWVVIGVCLTKVLTPALRNVLATEIPNWHNVLCQPPTEIDKQVYGPHKIQLNPSTLDLNYKNVNNNHVHKSPRLFDYAVKDPLSLAKLFVLPFMSKFTGFDQTMDVSAVLSVIGEAAPFAGAAVHAKTVRSDIRNEWAHCNFVEWTDAKFNAAFQSMEKLLKSLNLNPNDQQELCDELNSWRDKGLQLCFGQPVDGEILTLLSGEVKELRETVQTWRLERKQVSALLLSNITKIQSNLEKEINDLRVRVEKCEKHGANNTLRIKRCEIQGHNNSDEIKLLDKKLTTELSRFYVNEEEKIPYLFSAPPRNRYFAGRTREIQELKRILKVEETMNEKRVHVAAVSGLGGIGKTSLVSEYAHQMKDFYKGGVYWFSAEDDTFLDKTVNDIALKIGALLGSFDLSLSNILRKISTLSNPSLFVLDCVDQLELSYNMMKFLSFPSQENIFGHFIVLTRRNPSRLVDEIPGFDDDFCLKLECFQSQEANQFLFSRTGTTCDENEASVAECLCEELGRLPLALEQAGACIKMLSCSLSSYLEQYKTERLRLLDQQRARPVSPGNESSARLAVQTTWIINMEHMKKSPNGQAAVRFMNACSFFNGNEIEEELINVGTPEVHDVAYRQCVSSPLGSRQIFKLLTDFSLFSYVCNGQSVSTHRLVLELVRESFDAESKAESFFDAVRMLSYAFSKCPSPSDLVSLHERNDKEQNVGITAELPESSSHFFMWLKLCMHGHHLCRRMDDLCVSSNSFCQAGPWFIESAKIIYECAVYLSANHRQEEAKRFLNFGYRVLDWLPSEEYKTVKKDLSNNSLFPLPIPLPKPFQIEIKRCCMTPFVPVQPLDNKCNSDSDLEEKIEKLRLEGNDSFKKGHYEEAVNRYSSAINLAEDCNDVFNPFLLTNRATVYIKLGQFEDALKDANDYITRRPDCWRGYARKALALGGLNEKVSAEITAALAFYHKRDIFSQFLPFQESFVDLKKRIVVCDSSNDIQKAIHSQDLPPDTFKILILGSKEYIIEQFFYPFNNCILVGTRKNCAVSLKSQYSINFMKCMVTNLSFFLENGQVYCVRGSFVKILNCKFTSNDDTLAAVSTHGQLNVEKSSFVNSKSGGLLCVGPGKLFVLDSFFCNNGKAGLEVREGGELIVKTSRMIGNVLDGLTIGPKASKCTALECDIDHNDREGIAILEHSTNITLKGNNVFGNDNGMFMTNSDADIRENNFFDNAMWGIWSQSNSWCNISMNKVFRNKHGGVRVGKRAGGTQFRPSIVEQNEIYDNIGQGFVENVNGFEVGESPNTNVDLMRSYFTGSVQLAKFQDNKIYNNKESENIRTFNISVQFCSSCGRKSEIRKCRECFTAAYCNRSCQITHWSKHKKLCTVLREKSSYLITSVKSVGLDATQKVEGRKKTNSKVRRHPSRDGSFVVKVHNAIPFLLELDALVLHDESFNLLQSFVSQLIANLVKNFGVLCKRKYIEKKLFFHCLLDEDGHPRLFTNEFPEFQNW